MGLTSGLNVGPGSIGMGFLAEDGNFSLSEWFSMQGFQATKNVFLNKKGEPD